MGFSREHLLGRLSDSISHKDYLVVESIITNAEMVLCDIFNALSMQDDHGTEFTDIINAVEKEALALSEGGGSANPPNPSTESKPSPTYVHVFQNACCNWFAVDADGEGMEYVSKPFISRVDGTDIFWAPVHYERAYGGITQKHNILADWKDSLQERL